jgi:hypothetical protein
MNSGVIHYMFKSCIKTFWHDQNEIPISLAKSHVFAFMNKFFD